LGLHLPNFSIDRDSSVGANPLPEPKTIFFPRLHFVASTYGSIGQFTTDTKSRSISGYFTISNSWRDYYTAGFASLWLERDDAGGKYYAQQLASLRASWFFGYRLNVAVHYAYLNEGEIAFYSNPAIFHFLGAGGDYWFSPAQVIGTSFTVSLSERKLRSQAYRGYYSFNIGHDIWLNSKVVVTKTEWTPTLLSIKELLSFRLGGDNHLTASAEIGRRAFYFDDDNLIVYNQRVVQTGTYTIKGTIRLTDFLYVIPALEYGVHDEYKTTHGSLGLKAIF
jgi:hypothetical protein